MSALTLFEEVSAALTKNRSDHKLFP